MNKPSGSPFVSLGLPLRDILRGMASFAEATEDMLEPAVQAMPAPMRHALSTAMQAIEGTGERLLAPHVSGQDIQRASAFLNRVVDGRGDAECCARVLAFAWERMRTPDAAFHDMLSETVAASRLDALRRAPGLTPSDFAAQLFLDLRAWHVAGSAPGLPVSQTDDQQEAIDLKLFAFLIWLLAVRSPEDLPEEQLLEMAMALTQAFRADVLAAISDSTALSGQLQTLSDHL